MRETQTKLKLSEISRISKANNFINKLLDLDNQILKDDLRHIQDILVGIKDY